MKNIIELENWKRKNHFNFFRNYDNPFFNICTNIDITELYNFCKSNNLSLFLSYLYLSIKSANELLEFRLRIENDNVYEYDLIHPSSTILNDDKTFSFCDFNFVDSFKEFYKNSETSIDRVKNKISLDPKESRHDVIHYTTIPWISLTSFSHACNFGTSDSIPKIVFGKIFKDGNKTLIPKCVEVHHSLVDGYHVGVFFDNFSNHCLVPSKFLNK